MESVQVPALRTGVPTNDVQVTGAARLVFARNAVVGWPPTIIGCAVRDFMAMSAVRKCANCNLVLPDDSADGLCPNCRTDKTASEANAETISSPVGALTESGRTALPGDGETFGDYEIIEEIAHGGMGVVFKARQKSLHRIVALKMIRGERLVDDEGIRRFHVEARAAAQLPDPLARYGQRHAFLHRPHGGHPPLQWWPV